MRTLRFVVLLAAATSIAAGSVRAGTALDYRGLVLPARTVESLARGALQSPRDSSRLAPLLGEVVSRLEDLGYLDAHATADWEESETPRLRIDVTEGRRYRLARVGLITVDRADSAALADGLALRAGAWASPRAIAQAIQRSLAAASDRGHPYAALGVAAWDLDSAGLELGLSGSLGPRVTISGVRIEGLKNTRPSFAEQSRGHLVGLPYNPAAAEAARRRLEQLGVFRSVQFTGIEGEADGARARLLYRVEEPRFNRFEGAFGVQGEHETVGLAHLEVGNLLGTGRAIGLDWESRGRGITSFGARYAEPLLLGAPLKLEVALEQNVQASEYIRTRFGGKLRYALTAAERVEAGYEEQLVVQDQTEVQQSNARSTVLAMERGTLDDALAPRRGSRLRISAAEIFVEERLRPLAHRSSRGSAVEVSGEWHRPLTAASGVALEISSASRFSSDRVLHSYDRYPLGGAASLRGYDEEAFRVDRYALSRLEWRWFMGPSGQRVFLFWDHAWMQTREPLADGGDRMSTLERDGFGFGLRVEAAGSLAGIDYGLSPGLSPLEGRIHLRLISAF
jgi:outer membrane protein assembly factor BamA